MPSVHPVMAVVGEDGDGVVVVVVDEADVVAEEEVIGGEITTVTPKRREKESNWQPRKAQIPVRERRGDGQSSQTADLT